MANPRKFSEKIALQKQKQAEGTAEFEKIMKEVSAATSKEDEAAALCNKCPQDCGPLTMENTNHFVERESRGRSVGVGPIRRPVDRKQDRSPYGSTNFEYLNPPSGSCWRRASSDSAIHQTLLQGPEKRPEPNMPTGLVSSPQKRSIPIDDIAGNRQLYATPTNNNNCLKENIKPANNVNMYRLSGENTEAMLNKNLQSTLMAANNTGSLPDLTSIHYIAPFGMALDGDQMRVGNVPIDSGAFCEDKQRLQDNRQSTHLSFTNLSGLTDQYIKTENLHTSHGNLTTASGNITEYRSPQCRPSPGSSPVLYSPSSDSNLSAPCSPSPKHFPNDGGLLFDKISNQNNGEPHINQALHNHFESFSLVDNCSPECAQINVRTDQEETPTGGMQYHNFRKPTVPSGLQKHPHRAIPGKMKAMQDNINDNGQKILTPLQPGYNSRISNIYQTYTTNNDRKMAQKNQQTFQYQNTTTTVPEIVFSDFSSGNSEYPREMFGSLDLELGPMDVAGLQMLSDPSAIMIADPLIEESFRRDLN